MRFPEPYGPLSTQPPIGGGSRSRLYLWSLWAVKPFLAFGPSAGPKEGSEEDRFTKKGRRNFNVSARRHVMRERTKERGVDFFV